MNLPTPPKKEEKPKPPPKFNRINVDSAGKISLNGQVVELSALKSMLTALKARDPETPVVVKGAADVDYQNVISVLDILQQVDITKIGLATETSP
jgi:biopolymer transport protein ExbD